MKKSTADAANVAVLKQIQEQMRDLCQPHYDEFYKVTTERGFTKLTIPKKKQAA